MKDLRVRLGDDDALENTLPIEIMLLGGRWLVRGRKATVEGRWWGSALGGGLS
jgi:hypothetical protein